MTSTQRVIKTRWGVKLNEITAHEGVDPVAVTYSVTSQRTGDVRNFRTHVQAEVYFDQEVVRSWGKSEHD
jgi:hypothetical protein